MRKLDFTPFESILENWSTEDQSSLESLVLNHSLRDVQNLLFEKKVTCVQLVTMYLKRIALIDDDYLSVLQVNPKVLEQAQELDRKLSAYLEDINNDQSIHKNSHARQSLGDLFGVVILIKDNVSEMNMNTAAGADVIRHLTTKRDAFVVNKLKESGALILGKNNLSEWSNFMSNPSSNGFSVVGGQTRNAIGDYDAGGSSSGPAVSASLNFAMITIGSETCGSLVYPAALNEVVTVKPTVGLLSRDLVIPITEAQDTLGVMGRTVQDVYDGFVNAIGFDKNDPKAMEIQMLSSEVNVEIPPPITLFQKPPATLQADFLQGKRIGLLKETSERASQLKDELSLCGATVIEVEMETEKLEEAMMEVLYYGIVHDLKDYLNHPEVVSPVHSLEEILAYNQEDPEKRMPYGARIFEEALSKQLTKEAYEALVHTNRETASKMIDEGLQAHQLVSIASFRNELSAVYAPACYPALTVPAGRLENGEPYGVTFVGTYLSDETLFQIGYAYEQKTHHRK